MKKYLPAEDIQFLEIQMDSELELHVKEEATLLPPKKLINGRPIFKNNLEKYEWLIKNEPDNKWLQEFKNTKEYKIYYGDEK